jgi:predicted transglutaminase-like cysteine proteinase
MPQRFRVIQLVLVLAAATAPASAQTTTTTGTPTTSTTILGAGCVRNPTLCRINSRLEALRETVNHAWTSLGLPLDPIVFRLQRSSNCLTRASGLCNGRLDVDESRARRQLQRCVRPIAMALAKIRSNYGRRIIPPDLAAAFASEADGLLSDLKAARESLTCPPDAAVGRTD